MNPFDFIELDPRVCNGKPVIKGTRIPIRVILEQLAEGESVESVLEGYPELKREDVKATLYYVLATLDNTEVTLQ